MISRTVFSLWIKDQQFARIVQQVKEREELEKTVQCRGMQDARENRKNEYGTEKKKNN